MENGLKFVTSHESFSQLTEWQVSNKDRSLVVNLKRIRKINESEHHIRVFKKYKPVPEVVSVTPRIKGAVIEMNN